MPRISMFLDADFPPDPRVENEATSLVENGFEVHLLSLTRNRHLPKEEIINGIHVYRYRISELTYRLSALAYDLPFYHKLIRKPLRNFIARTRPDFLHVHDMLMARAVMIVNRDFNLPLTLDLHENRPEIMQFYPHVQSILGRLTINIDRWRHWQRRLAKNADKVITVTELAKRQLAREAHVELDKIVVVPNTIKKELFLSYPIDQGIIDRFKDKKVVLYLGDTGLRRGTDTGIQAMAKLSEKYPDVLLVLVGQSRDNEQLKKLVNKLNIDQFVSFEGWQDMKLFPSYIKAATVTISPLKRNTHHDTTYANKLFQYMAYGKPLVVSDCPAQEALIRELNCGRVHKADDANDLVMALDQLLADSKYATELGDNGRRALEEKYNWDVQSAGLIELYQELSLEFD